MASEWQEALTVTVLIHEEPALGREAAESADGDVPVSNQTRGAGRTGASGGVGRREVDELAATEPVQLLIDTNLRDIGEASFGRAQISEIVHGSDDRVQITNTAVYPWSAHASLLITAADNSTWIGTGWFIGPHTLMTAGHCVYIRNSGVAGRDGWVKRIDVMPGRNGNTRPFGAVASTSFRSVIGWTLSGDERYDYGAIILTEPLGNTVGWFGFEAYDAAALVSAEANISGYPGDKPVGTQWYDVRQISAVDDRKIYYDIDSAGGQSGSAVYRIIAGLRYGVAIHTYGGATTNSGTRLVAPVYSNMVAWKAERA